MMTLTDAGEASSGYSDAARCSRCGRIHFRKEYIRMFFRDFEKPTHRRGWRMTLLPRLDRLIAHAKDLRKDCLREVETAAECPHTLRIKGRWRGNLYVARCCGCIRHPRWLHVTARDRQSLFRGRNEKVAEILIGHFYPFILRYVPHYGSPLIASITP